MDRPGDASVATLHTVGQAIESAGLDDGLLTGIAQGPHIRSKTGDSGLLGTLLPGLVGPARSGLSGTIKAGPGPHFYDEYNRTVIMRGLNVLPSAKVPDFEPIKNLSTLDTIKPYGVNAVRLLFIWEAYETSPSVYDASYLAYYDGVIEYLWNSLGIRSIVDVHQDGLSRYLLRGCGDGFPKWWLLKAIDEGRLHEPKNGNGCVVWPAYEDEEAKNTSSPLYTVYQSFYSDHDGMKNDYFRLWDKLSSHYNSTPGVLGFDLFNEPLELPKDQSIIRVYDELVPLIRANFPTALIFSSPNVITGLGPIDYFPTEVPTYSNTAYAGHYYANQASKIVNASKECSNPGIFNQMNATKFAAATKWKAPWFVGEYGIGPYGCLKTGGPQAYIQSFYTTMNDLLLSGTQWDWAYWTEHTKDGFNGIDLSVVDESFNVRDNYVVWPYVQAFGGEPGAMHVNATARIFTASWTVTPELFLAGSPAIETGIFVPQPFFKATSWAGVKIKGSSGLTCSTSYDQISVTCIPSRAGSFSVTITPP
ncbi:g13487 [Coccomyxa viridis]|uniref:G13487 protein n=1 Tax=Coccomyxa viridis TaxID=1274662 RepID=A0ABP1GFG5_9CHLO